MVSYLADLSSLSEPFIEIFLGITGLLILFTIVFGLWNKKSPSPGMKEIVVRIYSWWIILFLIIFVFLLPGDLATIVTAFFTFVALREFLTKLEVTKNFRKTLLYVYLTIPLQFYFAKYGSQHIFNAFIPIYMFFLIAMRNIVLGNYKNYLEFNGKVFWVLMLVVFGFSQVSFLRHQTIIGGYEGGSELLILLILFLTQFNDVLQFLWGKTMGRNKLSPNISPNKTIEGFLGAAFTLAAITAGLASYLPFTSRWEAALFGLLLSVFGLFGDLNMSAVKRDLGVKDMDDLIPGHGGILDRLDSISFTLPFTVQYLILRGYL